MGMAYNKVTVHLVLLVTISVLVQQTQSVSVDKLLRQCLASQRGPTFLSQKGTFSPFVNRQSRMEYLYQRFFDQSEVYKYS